MFDWYDISQKFVLLHMFQGWFPSISAWLFLTWSLSCSLDPLPRVSEFLKRLFVHCPTTQVHMQTHPFTDELRSPVRKQDQCNGTTQRRAGFSSAGMNRVTESAWAECWYNYQTAAGNSCCHTSSHSRAGAPVGRVGWDSRVCRWCLQRAAPCARSAALTPLLLVLHAWHESLRAWLTPDLSLKVSVSGIQKSCEAQPWKQKAAPTAWYTWVSALPGGDGLQVTAEFHSQSWCLPLNTVALNATTTGMHKVTA